MTNVLSLRAILMACVLLCGSLVQTLVAADASGKDGKDNPTVIAFIQAFASDDSTAKRESLRAVAGLPKELDDIVYKLLVQAVGDRQTHDDAVLALRARTGLAPTINNRGTGYPGYPNSDEASEWNNWLAARTKDKEQAKKLADQEKKIKDLEKKDDKPKGDKGDKAADGGALASKTPGTGDTAPGDTKPARAPEAAPSDLGKPSRIIFKNGGSLVCYVIFKRTDSDGVMQSVRIVHLDGGGEETLAADLIARIEESSR